MSQENSDNQHVYFFAADDADGKAEMKNLLGGKGANLAEMCRLGIPVPAGFTLTTEVCTYFSEHDGAYPEGTEAEVDAALDKLAKVMGRRFGDAENPLLLSVRSGARASMPGMMETVLNVGLTRRTIEKIIAKTGNARFVYDAYRRLITMYSDVVMEKAAGLEPKDGEGIRHQLEELLDELKRSKGVSSDNELEAEDLEALCGRYLEKVESVLGRPFPDDAREQLWGAVGAVFRSWNGKRAVSYRRIEGIPDDWGTAVNVQSMVFGNLGDGCATGVAFTRNPSTGENAFYGEWLPNAQGEDVVAGIRTPYALNAHGQTPANAHLPTLEAVMPERYAELDAIRTTLENHFTDMQDVEFTVEEDKLWMLQTRTGKRNGIAALRIAVDMAGEGLIDRPTAIRRVKPDQLDEHLHPMIDPAAAGAKEALASGLPAGPGGAVGAISLTADDAAERAAKGEKVVLVRAETSPEDVDGMHSAVAIVTARGGMTSHAALVARGWGKTCVVGCSELEISVEKGTVRAGDIVLRSGDMLSVDGTHGHVYAGELPLQDVDPEKNENLAALLGWCDEQRRLGVWTNADNPGDAAQARRFGAEGIGLCRTEHMFFGDERILPMREMILAENVEARRKALDKLLPYQRSDFEGIFRAMDGLPVTIRLLDPPLHEFLPHDAEAQEELASDLGVAAELVRERVFQLGEQNPMLGLRGCRLGILYEEITRMQARAIFEAAAAVRADGVDARPHVMVPLVGHVSELAHQKGVIEEVLADVEKTSGEKLPVMIGTMIEVPRAAITADEVAREAEFFSFGTNDLTQMTCGFSRDDAGSFLGRYAELGIYPTSPFESLDQTGVGQLVDMAAERGRQARPELELGICGEHGGDPASIDFFHRVGLDYVSCSPFRVPVARLAAAQAALREEKA